MKLFIPINNQQQRRNSNISHRNVKQSKNINSNHSFYELTNRTSHRISPENQQKSFIDYYSDVETNLVKQNKLVHQVKLKIFPTPNQIQSLVNKRLMSNDEAQKRKKFFFEREERKQSLINDPFIQIYLQQLKKQRLRLPSILD